MLSILIPIYNWNCLPLVVCLQRQAEELSVEYEIVCLDDASDYFREENRVIASLERCRYEELPRNIGRSRIRNRLGLEARFDYLLFLDCDAAVTNHFLRSYVDRLSPRRVIVGSVSYGAAKPSKEQMLRYRFGKQREELTAAQRQKAPYDRFNTFNFLIPKTVLLEVGFDESLSRYGHEDTLLGIALEQHGVEVMHIDTPVCHSEIDTNRAFVRKTEQSVENLLFIERKIGRGEAARRFRLVGQIDRWSLVPLLSVLFSLFGPLLKRLLTTTSPFLFLLDLYKAGYYAAQSRRKGLLGFR